MLAYLIVMLVTMYVDAMASYAVEKKYNILHSFLCSLAWPVMLPVVIYQIWKGTK